MKKRIKHVISIYFLLIFSSYIVQSCCEHTYIINGKGTLHAFQLNDNHPIQHFVGPTTLAWQLDQNMVNALPQFSLLPQAYAVTCDENFHNQVEVGTLRISLDKDLEFKGRTIKAGTNFAPKEGMSVEMSLYGRLEINFTQDFLDQAKFEKGPHTFSLTVKTDDNREFSNSIELYVELE